MTRASGAAAVPGRFAVALLLLLGLGAAGCAHLPKIIVLEDPLSADEHVALGVAYERNGELALASREYERALEKDKASFRARFNLGNVRLAEKRYGKARDHYLAALAVRPGDPEATNNLAWAAIFSGSWREDALRRMETVTSNPAHRSPPILDTLGVLLGELSRPADAEAVFAEAQRRCDEQHPSCTQAVQEELSAHREALRAVRPAPGPAGLVGEPRPEP